MREDNMPAGFNGSVIIQVLAGDGAISAISNIVNYSVINDGSASFNLFRTEIAGPSVTGDLVPDISLVGDPDEPTEGETFLLTAQLEDSFGKGCRWLTSRSSSKSKTMRLTMPVCTQ